MTTLDVNKFLQNVETPEKEERKKYKDMKDELQEKKRRKVCFQVYQGREVQNIILQHISLYFFSFFLWQMLYPNLFQHLLIRGSSNLFEQ